VKVENSLTEPLEYLSITLRRTKTQKRYLHFLYLFVYFTLYKSVVVTTGHQL